MWQAVEKLAERFERAWSQTGYALDALPELAEREVEDLLGDRELTTDAILDALAASADWSEQLDPYTHFGEPAVTVHKTERWVLDVYLWLHPVTALHDHRFRGAFGVVGGLTQNSTYHFTPRAPRPDGIEVGRLTRRQTELLRPGSVRRILPGSGFIHQVVHIARPTVSVALRTAREPDLPSQREYFAPGLAVPSLPYLSHPQRRKLELIGTLVALGGPRLEERLGELVSREDETCAFWMLYRMFHASGYRVDLAQRVLERAGSPVAHLCDEILTCLRAVAEASRWWGVARAEPQRLLVALATTIDDAGEIAQRIEEYGGAPAAGLLAEWLAAMKRGEDGAAMRATLGKRALETLVDRLAEQLRRADQRAERA
jgi:hypothetical protein